MAKSITVYQNINGTIGGEKVRFTRNSVLTVGDVKHDIMATVAEDNGTAVLYTAASNPVSPAARVMIFVDPDAAFVDGAAARQLTIEITGSDGSKAAVRVRGETPLILGAGAFGADIDNLDETIATITAKNQNAVGDPAGSNDVTVRILIFT